MNWLNLIFFILFLLVAAIQDMRNKSIAVWVYYLFGGLATFLCLCNLCRNILNLQLTGNWLDVVGGMAVGLCLLGISRITRGAVGEGDGWFFLISGVYLGFWNNLKLLMYGGIICSVFCLGILMSCLINGRNIRKSSVPFLPFLIPAGLWMVLMRAVE